mmetsp:Transcript_17661/g.31961  ORF Transcript_17661/g.31961 Transcript_17661/m.31961 type:complete len:802 (+) Transcript_17661:56-2461(+)
MGCAQPAQHNCGLCGYTPDAAAIGNGQHAEAKDFALSSQRDIHEGTSDHVFNYGTTLNGHSNGQNGQTSDLDDGVEGVEAELLTEPKDFNNFNFKRRRLGVCAESIKSGYYKAPYWVKHQAWETALYEALESCFVFQRFTKKDIWTFVHTAEVHLRYEKEVVTEQGAPGDALLVMLDGSIDYFRDGHFVKTVDKPGTVIDPTNVLWKTPSAYKLVARDEVTFAKLRREEFTNISVRLEFYKHEEYQELLRNTALLETLHDEGIRKLADVAVVRSYQKGQPIITQGDEGHEFYILLSGTATASTKVGDDVQDCAHYTKGGLFGELALTDNKPRAANVTCTDACLVICLTKAAFERMVCPMGSLAKQAYLTDPRKLIADFYQEGDSRGPYGSLVLQDLKPRTEDEASKWFAVYRPTSRDAIMKMLSGSAVGKGLNVKGKSAKQGVLSGYVPFCQISDNKHKAMIEKSPPNARLKLYFKTEANRAEALKAMQQVMENPESKLDIAKKQIHLVNDYEPRAFGLDLPEPLLREAYIMNRDLEPKIGWETGRRSEPAFMDMNLHAIRDESQPKVVLYQHDESDPMNPRGLLIAYAEQYVKPVVSDFDTFCVGSKGMDYDPLPQEQVKLVQWCLNWTKHVLKTLDGNPWTSRWLTILAEEKKSGNLKAELPKYGFGDPTSYRLIADVVKQTETCGAVRHGAECCNFMFPQELDDEFLVVWHGFPAKPWAYYTEEQVRHWLIERAKEGFSIPLNPVWPIRDPGWYDVLQVLRESEEAKPALQKWFPEESGILAMIDSIHEECPKGFSMA